ncbi:HAMP domain-containing sensor histidine kinase [Erysipelothrix enhydrae]|uniref:sensor histidine kinase n=1 Tax=Erysipelothrix enhydrae TaxID=2890314 RepID=UPI002B246677|nr:HAMP domain-containing sensor histidine kinase [Erysipelothrix sp. 4322-04]WRB86839.1 HAMP domain-containing sensor histidine kinase [Erysipelothrix sp. 4322-04]
MNKLNLLQKNFIYTFSVLISVVLLIHGILYSFIPTLYLNQKHQDLKNITQELTSYMNHMDNQSILKLSETFAYVNNTNMKVTINNQSYPYYGLMQFHIEFNEDLTIEEIQAIQNNLFVQTPGELNKVGVILETLQFQNNFNEPINVQVMMSVQPVHEIKALTLKLLPYSSVLCIIIAGIAAFVYSKKITKPIRDLLKITNDMAAFKEGISFSSDSNDEIAQLGFHINKMYASLLKAISTLQHNLKRMENLEEQKEMFFKAASHELRTPLTSLSILLENMIYGIRPYNNHEKYLPQALELVGNTNVKLKQILDASSVDISPDHHHDTVAIHSLISDIIKQNQLLIEHKHLDIEFKASQLEVDTNKRLIQDVLNNIIGNAVVHSLPNTTIVIELQEQGLTISNTYLTDQAIETDKLFEPFYRCDKSRGQGITGNGLGLYITKRNLERLNITYHVQNLDNRFIFKIYF